MKELDLSELTSDESFLNFCFQRNSEDVAYWENWLAEHPEYKEQVSELRNAVLVMAEPAADKVIANDYHRLQESISGIGKKRSGVIKLWPYISVVAAAVALIVLGVYFFRTSSSDIPTQSAFVNDVAPGKQTATLTLASGKKIRLSDAAKGELAKEAGVVISKTEDGQVTYKVTDGGGSDAGKTNTLTTARGETYTIVLPEGTRVSLNAESSLTYPVSFAGQKDGKGLSGSKRLVQLSGEGYFEVSKDKRRPFVVKTAGQEVEVLGTHFNINAYGNEKELRTTLLEGSVRVSSAGISKVIQPGEQAVNTGNAIQVLPADLEATVAWQKGTFVMNDESLGSIMRKIERWYDVQVVYEGVSEDLTFYGTVSRYKNISEILETMQLTGSIHFKVEGKKVTVTK